MTKQLKCLGCINRQKKIEAMTAAMPESEWWKRGSELEKINALVAAWDVHLPVEFHDKVRSILDGYIERCTCKGSTGSKKYQKGAKRWKAQKKKVRKKALI